MTGPQRRGLDRPDRETFISLSNAMRVYNGIVRIWDLILALLMGGLIGGGIGWALSFGAEWFGIPADTLRHGGWLAGAALAILASCLGWIHFYRALVFSSGARQEASSEDEEATVGTLLIVFGLVGFMLGIRLGVVACFMLLSLAVSPWSDEVLRVIPLSEQTEVVLLTAFLGPAMGLTVAAALAGVLLKLLGSIVRRR